MPVLSKGRLAIDYTDQGAGAPVVLINSSQSLCAQAMLVVALREEAEGEVHLVGHSFGASVALKAALLLGERVKKLVLIEPNPFNLLKQQGRVDAFLESRALRDHVKCFGSLGDWERVAERFADYWLGDGAWAAMPEKRRTAFAAALPPNFHEWDAVMSEETTLEGWTRRPIREIVELFAAACPHWSFRSIEAAGHMAPIVRQFLDSTS